MRRGAERRFRPGRCRLRAGASGRRASCEPGADVSHRVLEPIVANSRHDDEPVDARLARALDELLAEWLEGGEGDLERRAAGRGAQPGELPYEGSRRVDRQAEAVPAVGEARRAPERRRGVSPDDDRRMRPLVRLRLEADAVEGGEAPREARQLLGPE